MDETNLADGGLKTADLQPGSLLWRIVVARMAYNFFNPIHPHQAHIAKVLGRQQGDGLAVWTVADFGDYLQKEGVACGYVTLVTQLLSNMERAGMFLSAGYAPTHALMGQRYASHQIPDSANQMRGNLWLSSALGPDFIIESYKLVTVMITGDDADNRGTGLILDGSHVLTNKHVTRGLGNNLTILNPGPANLSESTLKYTVHEHPQLDIAVVEVERPDGHIPFTPLDGMVFRDPAWADEVYLLGYPRVPWMVGDGLTIQRGEVVHPIAEAPAVRDDDTDELDLVPSRTKFFLYSAIARPGNSGGPIVAHDGRVIGLVVEYSTSSKSNRPDERSDDTPFYRGIPSCEIRSALNDLGLPNIAIFE